MVDDTRRRTSRKVDVRAEVRGWLKRGVRCVPIAPKKKKPKGGEGWNKLRITEATIDDHFSAGDNFGGLWGEPSGWIVDVDLDWMESTIIASELLPPTYIYGRLNRPRTHYLYRCEGIKTVKFKSVDKDIESNEQTIIEIRSTGTQSVLPGSIHEEGDQYTVDEDVPFRTLSVETLTRLVRRIAALSVMAHEYPSGGGHDYMHAVCGSLLHSGWSKVDVKAGCLAVLSAVGPLEDHPEQRVRTITNTIDKHDTSTTHGWPTLGEHISSARVLEQIKKWCEGGETLEALPAEVRPVAAPTRIPMHLMKPPGLVGEIAEWSNKRSYIKQPVFDLAVGLMCVAMASVNRYVIDGWKTPLQPYIMILAPTAGGKESAMDTVYDFCRRIRLHDFCFQGFQSYHSMLDRLGEDPGIACWLWDEAGRKLKTAGKGGGSQEFQIITWILSLYGKGARSVPGLPARGQAIENIEHPFMTILAASQGRALMEAVTDADLSTGVINRFMLFDAGDEVAEENNQYDDFLHPDIIKRADRIRNRPPASGVYPFHRIGMETGVRLLFQNFNREARAKAGQVEVWGRANQNALILAGTVALGMSRSTTVMITREVAEWAIELMRWTLGRWESRMSGAVARNRTEGYSKMVLDYIRDARKYVGKARRPKQKDMMKRGFMTRTTLSGLCTNLYSKELDAVIDQLKKAELITEGEEDGITVYVPLDS